MATARSRRDLGEVDALGLDALGLLGPTQILATRCGGNLDGGDGLVKGLARDPLIVQRRQAAEGGLQRGQVALLAEQLGLETRDVVKRVGVVETFQRCVARGMDVVDHRSPSFTGESAGSIRRHRVGG